MIAFADCQRCGAAAHPIRGYCGRFCEEAARYEVERREGEAWTLHCHKPGYHPRVAGLDPVTPEETTAAYAEAYAAIERDMSGAMDRAWALRCSECPGVTVDGACQSPRCSSHKPKPAGPYR